MTLREKIRNLTWWNSPNQLKDILLESDKKISLVEERVDELGDNNFNESGQVKINYTGLTSVNFSANVTKTLDTNTAIATIVSSPTTTYPNSTPSNYKGVFDNTRGSSPVGRFIENPIDGQVHVWRAQVLYSNKGVGNNGSLDIILTNPVSGFQYVMPFTLPSGRTGGVLNLNAITIADQVSIPSPQGYILQAQTSFSDNNLTVEIASITRISQAIETKI